MRERDRLSQLKGAPTSVKVLKKGAYQTSIPEQNIEGIVGKKLAQAGIRMGSNFYIGVVAFVSLVLAFLASKIGFFLAAFVAGSVFYYFSVWFLDDMAQKRKKKVIPQLAPFIDGLASALGTGYNLEGAVEQATIGVPPGILRTELDRVVIGISQGLTLKEALKSLRDRITGNEITSLVVSVKLFSTSGGHVLESFRRLASKIREQEQVMEKAGRDLVLVRQAFYIILILSLLAPGILLIVEPEYIAAPFSDPMGKIILQVAASMILASLMIFKRLTSLNF